MDKTDSHLPDLEKSPTAAYSKLDGDAPEQQQESSNSLYARLQRWASRFKIETRGIERVPEDERPMTRF
ncbi:hypothetical protein PInf_009026 [Phytophthora infestans]|nr:hypothetical protein PInf_009026 [Phytophthora infestans]